MDIKTTTQQDITTDFIYLYHRDIWVRNQSTWHKKAIELAQLPNTTPSSDSNLFVYVPKRDIWIRIKGIWFESLLKRSYVYLPQHRIITERTIYNTGELNNNPTVDIELTKQILSNIDVFCYILQHACMNDLKSYMRLRIISKFFKEAIDNFIPLTNLVHTRCRDSYITKLTNTPNKVIRIYIKIYPDKFVQHMEISRALYWLKQLYIEPEYQPILLQATLTLLQQYKGSNMSFIDPARIRLLLDIIRIARECLGDDEGTTSLYNLVLRRQNAIQ